MISGHYLVSASETNDNNQRKVYYEERSFTKDSWKQFVSDRDTGYTAGDTIRLSGHCVCFSEISNEDMQSCQGNLQKAYEEYLENYISISLGEIERNIERLEEEWGNKNRILIYGEVDSVDSIRAIIQRVLECLIGNCSEIQSKNTEMQTILQMCVKLVAQDSSENAVLDFMYNNLYKVVKEFNAALDSKISGLNGHIRFLFYIKERNYDDIHCGKEILPEQLKAISCVENIILGKFEKKSVYEVLDHILSMYRDQNIDKNSDLEKEVEKNQSIYKSILIRLGQLIQDPDKEVIMREIIKESHTLEEYNEEYHINEQGGIDDVR